MLLMILYALCIASENAISRARQRLFVPTRILIVNSRWILYICMHFAHSWQSTVLIQYRRSLACKLTVG